MGIDDATKRKLASRQLVGRAMDWWNSITLETPEEDISQELFQTKFEAKFILGLDEYLGNQLVDHLDGSFEKIVEKALRHESLFPKKMFVVAPKEDHKPQQGSKNKKWKQQQQKGKDGRKSRKEK